MPDNILVQEAPVEYVKKVPIGWLNLLKANGGAPQAPELNIMQAPVNDAWKAGLDLAAKQPAVAPVATVHHITVTGSIEFEDYETFGSNEHGSRAFHSDTKLATDDVSATLLTVSQGFGGEERVEIDMSGYLREDGMLSVSMQTRFFEGATEGTTEQEDEEGWNSVVPSGTTSNFTIKLVDDEDDWAVIRGNVSNRQVN